MTGERRTGPHRSWTRAIRTARLELLPLRAEHAGELAELLDAPELYAFIGGAPDRRALRSRYQRLAAGSPDPRVSWCNWVIRPRGADRLAGTVQATVTAAPAGPVAEVAWLVGTAHQRRGIATEAAVALVGRLAAPPVREVVAHVHPDHLVSAAVAAAAGLTSTGLLYDGEVRWRLEVPAPPG